MDDHDPLDGFDEPDSPDRSDLELVARLRDDAAPGEATVARHHHQLMAAIGAATSTGTPSNNGVAPPPALSPSSGYDAPDGDDRAEEVPDLSLRPSRHAGERRTTGRRRNRRRPLAVAAAAVVLAGGLMAVRQWAPDREESTVAGPSETEPCGTELPFAFPVPSGFEGPRPGPSGPHEQVSDPYGPQDALRLHWQKGDMAIDVRWPASLPTDPTTPTPEGYATVSGYSPSELVEGSLLETFSFSAIGADVCTGLDVNVTSADPDANQAVIDQLEKALLGPGGPLEPDAPLVIDSTPADELPAITESPACGVPATEEGPGEDAATYPSAREALGFYVAAYNTFPLAGYEELTLPDGSYGYVMEDPLPDGSPGTGTYVTLHVVPVGDRWKVASWKTSSC